MSATGEIWQHIEEPKTIYSYYNEASPSLKGLKKTMFIPVFLLLCTLVHILQLATMEFLQLYIVLHTYLCVNNHNTVP